MENWSAQRRRPSHERLRQRQTNDYIGIFPLSKQAGGIPMEIWRGGFPAAGVWSRLGRVESRPIRGVLPRGLGWLLDISAQYRQIIQFAYSYGAQLEEIFRNSRFF